MIRVLLISREAVPSSLRTLVEKSSEVEFVSEASPEVILLYCALWSRTALTQMLQSGSQLTVPVVIVCQRAEEPFRTDSILHGDVSGVLPLSATAEQVIACLRAARAGLKVLQSFSNNNHSDLSQPLLTPRELEILRLIADGEGNKSIAYLLEISEHTVKFHISSIFEKLHVSSRTEAIKAGIVTGLISI